MREMVLLFHLPDRAKRRMVEMALLPLKVRLKYVSYEEYNQPLGVLAGNKDLPGVPGVYEGEELPDSFFVFSSLNGSRLDQVLRALRRCGAGPFPYKAVLTPANQLWTASRKSSRNTKKCKKLQSRMPRAQACESGRDVRKGILTNEVHMKSS